MAIWKVVSKHVTTQLVKARDAAQAVRIATGEEEGEILEEDEYCDERRAEQVKGRDMSK